MIDLTKGPVFKHIVAFSIPMLLGSVFQQLYNIIDGLVVGNILGTEALAAVGASFPVMFVLTSLIMGLTMGISVVISQFYGAKDMERVERAIDSMMIFVSISGVVVGLIGIFFSKYIFILMNIEGQVLEDATAYFRVFIGGVIFMFGYNGVSSVLRGLGDSKTPLYFLIVATILNAILDLIFVLVFKWGIVAVSWATVVSQAVACIGLVIYINKKHHFIKLKVFDLVFDKEIFKKSMLIGLPQGIQQTVVSMSMTLITSIVGSFGAATMAGFTVAIRIDSFAMMPIMNISMALTSFVGQNVGAGKYDRVKEALKASLILSLSISAVMGLIFIFAGDFLTGFFTKDLEVVRVGDDYLHIMGGFFVVLAAMFMLTGVLRGAGDSIIPMIISLTTLWGVRVPVSYLCSRDWTGFSIEHLYSFLSSMTWTKDGHDSGIWWGAPVSWVAGLILTYIYYKKGHWRNKSVVKKTNPD